MALNTHAIQSAVNKAEKGIGYLSNKMITSLTYGDDDKALETEYSINKLSVLSERLNRYNSINFTNDLRPKLCSFDECLQDVTICSQNIVDLDLDVNQGVSISHYDKENGKMISVILNIRGLSSNSYFLDFIEWDNDDDSFTYIKKGVNIPYGNLNGFFHSSFDNRYYVITNRVVLRLDNDFENATILDLTSTFIFTYGFDVNNDDGEIYLTNTSFGTEGIQIIDMVTFSLSSFIATEADPMAIVYNREYKKLFISHKTRYFSMMNTISRVITLLENDATKSWGQPVITSDYNVLTFVNTISSGLIQVENRSNDRNFSLGTKTLTTIDLSDFSPINTIEFSAKHTMDIDKCDNLYVLFNSVAIFVINKNLEVQQSTVINSTFGGLTSSFTFLSRFNPKWFNPENNKFYVLGANEAAIPRNKVWIMKYSYENRELVSEYPDKCSDLEDADACKLIQKIDAIYSNACR